MTPNLTCINDDPILLSLLYDLDLMPEQVKEGTPNWVRMQIIVQHWKLKSSESKEVPKCGIDRDSKEDDCGHLNKVSSLPSKDTKKEGSL